MDHRQWSMQKARKRPPALLENALREVNARARLAIERWVYYAKSSLLKLAAWDADPPPGASDGNTMHLEHSDLPEVLIITPPRFGDARG